MAWGNLVLDSNSLETVGGEAPICGICQFCGNKYSQPGPISSKYVLQPVCKSSGCLTFTLPSSSAGKSWQEHKPGSSLTSSISGHLEQSLLCSHQSRVSVTGKPSERMTPSTNLQVSIQRTEKWLDFPGASSGNG